MGRSQRHMVVEQGAPASGEAGAQGELAPALMQQIVPQDPVALGAEMKLVGREAGSSTVVVPLGPPGGPLQGSTMTGAIPESYQVPPPEPDATFRITGLAPFEMAAGTPDMNVMVQGIGFEDGAVVTFDGVDMATTFTSATQVDFTAPISTAPEGNLPVGVRNPGGALTETVPFSVLPPVIVQSARAPRRRT